MIEIGGRGARGEQRELQLLGTAPFLECGPRRVPPQRHLIEVVHTGAPEGAVRYRKARRLDDMRGDAEARAQAQNRSGIRRNVGLVKR